MFIMRLQDGRVQVDGLLELTLVTKCCLDVCKRGCISGGPLNEEGRGQHTAFAFAANMFLYRNIMHSNMFDCTKTATPNTQPLVCASCGALTLF